MERYRDFAPTGFDPKGLGLPDRQDWFVMPVCRTRDSGSLAESNFEAALKDLEIQDPDGTDHEVHSFGHWGPGWFEIIIVRPDSDALWAAEDIERSLADYPVLDETDLMEREESERTEIWDCDGKPAFEYALCREIEERELSECFDEIPYSILEPIAERMRYWEWVEQDTDGSFWFSEKDMQSDIAELPDSELKLILHRCGESTDLVFDVPGQSGLGDMIGREHLVLA